MARKKIEDELTKEMIVEEANRQFLTLDFNKVSMRAIAKELGCSHGAIYYHFNNKSELFNAVVEKYFSILNHTLEETLEYEGIEGTRRVLLGYMEFGLNFQSQYEFMFVKRNDLLDPLLQKAPNDSYIKFSDTLQKLNKNKLDPSHIYSTFMSLHGFVICYKGRVNYFNDAINAAQNHCEYLIKALVR